MLKDIFDRLFEESVKELQKEASEKEIGKKVYNYLSKDYPKTTLNWVAKGDWKRQEVKLNDIIMGRRPGGARETDKTKALQKKYESGEKLEPVILVKDGNGDIRLADGYHRTLAKKKAGHNSINAYIMHTDEKEGPWLKEMHEKKLSKGVKYIGEAIQKKASYSGDRTRISPKSSIGKSMSISWYKSQRNE